MATRVTREQFEVGEESLIHRPTGTRFVVRPPEARPCRIEWKRYSFRRGDYRRKAILEVASALIEERASKVGPSGQFERPTRETKTGSSR